MTAPAIADVFHARRTGAGWMAKCPAHKDDSPSLSIRDGKNGRVLVHCFAGCTVPAILRASGLQLRDIFAESPSPEQRWEMAAVRRKREEQARERRIADRAACDRIRRLEAVADELVSRLVRAPDDDPATNAMARLFHQTLDLIRLAEAEVAR
jgi:hypothetical protein